MSRRSPNRRARRAARGPRRAREQAQLWSSATARCSSPAWRWPWRRPRCPGDDRGLRGQCGRVRVDRTDVGGHGSVDRGGDVAVGGDRTVDRRGDVGVGVDVDVDVEQVAAGGDVADATWCRPSAGAGGASSPGAADCVRSETWSLLAVESPVMPWSIRVCWSASDVASEPNDRMLALAAASIGAATFRLAATARSTGAARSSAEVHVGVEVEQRHDLLRRQGGA